MTNSSWADTGELRKRWGQIHGYGVTLTNWSVVTDDLYAVKVLQLSCPQNTVWGNSDPVPPVRGQDREDPSNLVLTLVSSRCTHLLPMAWAEVHKNCP